MLINAGLLQGLAIHAIDGELGTVEEFLFDDDTWAVRYLIVDAGGWLGERRVLISPMSISGIDWPTRRLNVDLTREQVKHSPDVDTHQPVSRQHEATYLGYYGYPYYWNGPSYWGTMDYPMGMSRLAAISSAVNEERSRRESADCHLRSSKRVEGYHVKASDGEIGHVDGFIVDDSMWVIRYLAIATRNWLPGKKVLASPSWVEAISWEESKLTLQLSQEAIRSAPEYLESDAVTRAYENGLYLHYDRAPYWTRDSVISASAASGRA
jgi:hypothetical protein